MEDRRAVATLERELGRGQPVRFLPRTPDLAGWRREGLLAGPLALAASLAEAVGQTPTGSSLVCVPVAEPERVRAALADARIKAAVRGSGIRFSLHLWNDATDVERAADAIRPYLLTA